MGAGERRIAGDLPAARMGRVRSAIATVLLALLTTLTVGTLLTSPANALIHRGHSLTGAFETSGENELSEPTAVAVNEKSEGNGAGDTYVLDKGNNRVVRFGPNHEFLEAWGVGVENGEEKYERCKEATSCKPGIAGFGTPADPQFDEPVAIAVDNAPSGPKGSPSSGDVYVVANRSWKKAVIYKFDFEGKPVSRLVSKPEEKEEAWPLMGVAVDKSGVVWVEREGEGEELVLERFNNEVKNKLIGEPETFELPEVAEQEPVRPGFAIDALGHVYATIEPGGLTIEEAEELIEERAEERHEKKEPPIRERLQKPCVVHECIVARFDVAIGSEGQIEGEFDKQASEENTTGVAVDPSTGRQSSNDLYLDNLNSISAFTTDGALIQTFAKEQLAGGGGAGLAVNGASNEVLVADAKLDRVDVFGPTPVGPPAIQPGSVAAASVTTKSAKLSATIDPTGADTHYFFRYGTTPCLSSPSACGGSTPSTDIGAGFGDQPAAFEISGLSPSTTYHFLVVATSSPAGTPVEVQSVEEGTFTTLAADTPEATLPDGRAWELVSPVNKRGVSVEPLSHEGGLIQAAADGRGMAYIAAAPVGDEEPAGNRGPEPTQLVATRSAAGEWVTRNITPANSTAFGIQPNTRRAYQFFSSDLSLAAVFPVEPISSNETTEAVSGLPLYLRDTTRTDCTTHGCYEPLLNGSMASSGFDLLGAATPDLKHIGLNVGGNLLEWSAQPEAGEAPLRTVNVLPSGQTASGEVGFGASELTTFQGASNVISEDGSRVVWAQHNAVAQHLYQTEFREGSLESVQIDEPNEEAGIESVGFEDLPVYMGASTSGDRVFFTDNEPLTKDATHAGQFSGDLYVYERSKPVGERVIDLTPSFIAGESAAVQGRVLGIGAAGTDVYFVANGVLAEGATPGKCIWGGARSSKCNLYEAHYDGSEWEKPHFIARISNEDAPDWGAVSVKRTEFKVAEMTSRVSPNGRYLTFMSDQRLTPYNNLDAVSNEPDEEVYLYDSTSQRLVCASCNPTGARPTGVHDQQESGEGRGLLVDRLGIWSSETEDVANSHWLAASVPGWTNLDDRESFYQSRYLSDSGRLFFNAVDSLVKQDVNGKEDVYEYEPTGVGSCASENTAGGCVALISSGKSEHESAFLDASETGGDVFFLTSESLAPSLDVDAASDIYDARVCSGAAAIEACPATPPSSAAPCAGEACRAAQTPVPSYGPPASGSSSGSGNASGGGVLGTKQASRPKAKPLTRAQKLAAALKACKKKYPKSKQKRAVCEKQARKKYGAKPRPKSKAGAKKSSRSNTRGRR